MQTFFYNGSFGGYPVYLVKSMYQNKRVRIDAYDEDGCPAFCATVNLPEHKINADEAFIKDYAENIGVLNFLKNIGIVTKVIGYDRSGYVSIPLCKLNLEKLNECSK